MGQRIWEFVEHGYSVEISSPEGGRLEGDKWSDPRDDSRYSAHDLRSLGFISSPEHMKLVQNSRPLSSLKVEDLDAVLFKGGQGKMYTFYANDNHWQRVAFGRLQVCQVELLEPFGCGNYIDLNDFPLRYLKVEGSR
jgi:hypothetical protein